MTTAIEGEAMAYVAIHECGQIVAATVDYPEHKRDVARDVGNWLRRGNLIERRTVADAREADWCKCFRKRPADGPAG